MARLRDSPDDLFALCAAAAQGLGIPDPAFVEKDFWVVELLRSIVQPLTLEPVGSTRCSAAVRFKGGTSLSKAFGLINRFSEDVDILVECEGYGPRARDKRVLWPLCERARKDLGLNEGQLAKLSHKEGFTRNADYLYPQRIDSPATRTGVRLEMGIRGGTLPGTQRKPVRSYIADYTQMAGLDADYGELASVAVDAIAPVRTLAEKLALLHHAGTQAADANPDRLSRAGRHLYDVQRLLSSPDVIKALSVPGQSMDVLAADVAAKSAEFGWPYTPQPEGGYAASVLFQPTGAVRDVAEHSYQQALRLVWGQKPTFAECLATVAAVHDLL